MIPSATEYFTEKNGKKYLVLDTIDKYEEVFSGIKSEIETINGGEEMCHEKHYANTGVNADDNISLNKKLKFPTLTIIIRLFFKMVINYRLKSNWMNVCMNYKMLEYDRLNISEGIDVDMSDKSNECMLCPYWYFLNKNFSYGPYLCDGYYDIMQKSIKFKNIAIVHVRKSAYRIYFQHMSKHEAKKLMENSNLIDKEGVL